MPYTVLRAKRQFGAWGHEYAPNQAIPADQYESWPEPALTNRLASGDVAWEVPSDEELAKDAFPPVVLDEEDPKEE